MSALGVVLIGGLVTLLLQILKAEHSDWGRRCAVWLVNLAAWLQPPDTRDLCRREWVAELEFIAAERHATGIVWAASIASRGFVRLAVVCTTSSTFASFLIVTVMLREKLGFDPSLLAALVIVGLVSEPSLVVGMSFWYRRSFLRMLKLIDGARDVLASEGHSCTECRQAAKDVDSAVSLGLRLGIMEKSTEATESRTGRVRRVAESVLDRTWMPLLVGFALFSFLTGQLAIGLAYLYLGFTIVVDLLAREWRRNTLRPFLVLRTPESLG